MPEGDTIHRAALRLAPVLTGRLIESVRTPRARGGLVGLPAPGTEVSGVRAVGKHLVVEFADGRHLRTHLRMTGSWHLYRPGERWRKPEHLARVVLTLDDGTTAVCFSAPDVEWLQGPHAVPERLAHLGPDLCAADPDIGEAVRRLDTLAPGTEIADALLDQRVASGIGNVYKSEVCFALRVDPFAPLATIDHATRRALLERAARLLRANLGRARRITWDGGVAVYGKERRPCPRCGTPIRRRRQGPQARSTYWCPRCQPSERGGDSP